MKIGNIVAEADVPSRSSRVGILHEDIKAIEEAMSRVPVGSLLELEFDDIKTASMRRQSLSKRKWRAFTRMNRVYVGHNGAKPEA